MMMTALWSPEEEIGMGIIVAVILNVLSMIKKHTRRIAIETIARDVDHLVIMDQVEQETGLAVDDIAIMEEEETVGMDRLHHHTTNRWGHHHACYQVAPSLNLAITIIHPVTITAINLVTVPCHRTWVRLMTIVRAVLVEGSA